jgi:LSD1 subclass zinc finger protein
MTAFSERRTQDLQKLRELSVQTRGRITVTRVTGNPPSEIEIELRFRTAPSSQYPRAVQDVTRVAITLPSRYPFQEPSATIQTPILHPNVYSSGKVCLGTKWLPSQGLDLLVQRIVQIITFDPTILNEMSPANSAALTWYRETQRRSPGAFPTDTMTLAAAESPKKMSWSNVSDASLAKVVVECPTCRGKLSLPSGRKGQVRCPKCQAAFEVKT